MKTDESIRKITHAHAAVWKQRHLDRLIDQFIEECCEAIKEMMKHRRHFDGFGNRTTNILDELADVQLCAFTLQQALGCTPTNMLDELENRIERLRKKLKKQKTTS